MTTLIWIAVELTLLFFAMVACVVIATGISAGWRTFKEAWREERDYDPYD